jgi:hypothetical protein
VVGARGKRMMKHMHFTSSLSREAKVWQFETLVLVDGVKFHQSSNITVFDD